ncbi:MAG: endonuclease MutS2 [Methanobacteriaceae archaeon]|nr:endonuclease MutS2 [Methanobacteriaceae archaeon]
MDLTKIKGIGDKLAQKITDNMGGEKELLKVIQNYEVDRLANIDGVSQQKAVEIINSALGNPVQEFLKTDQAYQIYDDILKRISEFASTKYGKNRILLINPIENEDKIMENLKFVMNAKKAASDLPLNNIKKLLKLIHPPIKKKIKYDSSRALLVESRRDYEHLMDMNLNSYSSIVTADEMESLGEYEFIIYVYSEGLLELDDVHNITMVNSDSRDFEIVPEVILSYFYENYELLKNVLKVRTILGYDSILPEVITVLDSLKVDSVDEELFDKAVEDAKKRADEMLEKSIKKIDLSGDEVLSLMNEGLPLKIKKIFDDVIKEVKIDIKAETGCSFDPFIQKYPVEIDYQELERVKKMELAKKNVNEFEKKVEAASYLSNYKEKVEKEIRDVLEFDYEFALGCFAYYYDLHPPTIGNFFKFKEALHLNLALNKSSNIQRIDYTLDYPENVALLTGANSGGKTTLLETLAQISIMAQMGLPVCAKEATIKPVEEIYFFSKKRSLDAGAFESFLNTFMPIVTKDTNKLILLDELEAITELEAAVKIIASFIDFIKDSDSYAVIVTHMAREIMKHTHVRVDGIEAKGLDDDYNLIVDRTPKMNYLAKSTPELILRMIYNKSDGKIKEIYGKILEKF